MTTTPLVSVFIPTFNQVAFVAESLRSALDQDYDNLEVVVSDDGSTDGTVSVIEDYARRFPGRLVALTNQPHLGLTPNCNRTLRACRGKYIAFGAGDDLFLPGKIRRQVEWLEQDANRVMCGHDVEAFESETGHTIYRWSKMYPPGRFKDLAAIVRHGCPYGGVSVMVRKNALPASGYDERVHIVSDWKLWIDLISAGGTYGYIDGVYARYRRHSSNITDIVVPHFEDALRMLDLVEEEHPELARHCNYRRGVLELSLARWDFQQRNIKVARQHLRRSLRVRPMAWLPWVLLGVSLLPVTSIEAMRRARRFISAVRRPASRA